MARNLPVLILVVGEKQRELVFILRSWENPCRMVVLNGSMAVTSGKYYILSCSLI